MALNSGFHIFSEVWIDGSRRICGKEGDALGDSTMHRLSDDFRARPRRSIMRPGVRERQERLEADVRCTWEPLNKNEGYTEKRALRNSFQIKTKEWCRRGESNPRPRDYETLALPLSYAGMW